MKQDRPGSEGLQDSRVPEGTGATWAQLDCRACRALQDLTELPAAVDQEVSQVSRVQQGCWGNPAPPAPRGPQEPPDPRANWEKPDCLDSKEMLGSREREVTTVFQVHWARWERTGNVDSEGMLDPPVLQELKGSRELQETEVSQVEMVYPDTREPWAREAWPGRPAPKVYLGIWDVMESRASQELGVCRDFSAPRDRRESKARWARLETTANRGPVGRRGAEGQRVGWACRDRKASLVMPGKLEKLEAPGLQVNGG